MTEDHIGSRPATSCASVVAQFSRSTLTRMAKTFDDMLRERPGDPAARARHRARMLADIRAHQLRDLTAIWKLKAIDPRR